MIIMYHIQVDLNLETMKYWIRNCSEGETQRFVQEIFENWICTIT